MDLWTITRKRVRKASADLTYENGGLEPPHVARTRLVSGEQVNHGADGKSFLETVHTTVVDVVDEQYAHYEAEKVANSPLNQFTRIQIEMPKRSRSKSNMSEGSNKSH